MYLLYNGDEDDKRAVVAAETKCEIGIYSREI